MAEGKITLYGELDTGVPGGFIVDASLVKNLFNGTRKTIEEVAEASGHITLLKDKFYRIYQKGDISFYMERAADTRLHTIEISIITGETTYTVDFPDEIRWVNDLELNPNCRYNIIIEDDVAIWIEIPLT